MEGGPMGETSVEHKQRLVCLLQTPQKMNEGALKIKPLFEKETWSEPTINLPTIHVDG